MKRMRKANRPGPDPDPMLPSGREIAGFLSPACCAVVGYRVGFLFGAQMAAFLGAMVGVMVGALFARIWASDFYR